MVITFFFNHMHTSKSSQFLNNILLHGEMQYKCNIKFLLQKHFSQICARIAAVIFYRPFFLLCYIIRNNNILLEVMNGVIHFVFKEKNIT